MTPTWRASKYKVHKLLKRYILLELVLLQTNPTTTGSSANQPYHNWFFANQPYDSRLFSKPTLPHLSFFCKATLPHLVLLHTNPTTTGYLQTNSTTTGSLQTNPTTSVLCKSTLQQPVLLQTNPTTTGSSANQPYHNWFFCKPTLPHLLLCKSTLPQLVLL